MTKECIGFFKAISDGTRKKIFEAIGEKEMSVGDIATRLGLTQPNVSHHLKVLNACGCISKRREGKNVYYSADKKGTVKCCCGFFGKFKINMEM